MVHCLPAQQVTSCLEDETQVKVEVKADRFSNDTSWELIDYYSGEKFLRQRGYTMESNEYMKMEVCLSDGLYNFTIWDEYGENDIPYHNWIELQ